MWCVARSWWALSKRHERDGGASIVWPLGRHPRPQVGVDTLGDPQAVHVLVHLS